MIILAITAVGTFVLMLVRWMMPVMGLAGVEGEIVQPLAWITPALAVIFVLSIATLIFYLKKQAGKTDQLFNKPLSDQARFGRETLSGPAAENNALIDKFIRAASMHASKPDPDFQQAAPAEVATSAAENVKTAVRRVTATIKQRKLDDVLEDWSEDRLSELDEAVVAANRQLIREIPLSTPLHQLPPVLPEFAGRSFELAELLAARSNPENKILGLQGLGGV
jgi:hypothetical protein